MNYDDEQHFLDLVKGDYMVEVRYLHHDASKEPVFMVSIKEYQESQHRIEVIAKGYAKEGWEQAFKNAYIKFNQVKGFNA